jgi:hypothetical protein
MLELSPPLPVLLLLRVGGLSRLNTRALPAPTSKAVKGKKKKKKQGLRVAMTVMLPGGTFQNRKRYVYGVEVRKDHQDGSWKFGAVATPWYVRQG